MCFSIVPIQEGRENRRGINNWVIAGMLSYNFMENAFQFKCEVDDGFNEWLMLTRSLSIKMECVAREHPKGLSVV